MTGKALCFLAFFLSAQTFANYTCSGVVKGVSISPKNGQLLAEHIASLKWPVLCSVETEQNGISPEACKSIFQEKGDGGI